MTKQENNQYEFVSIFDEPIGFFKKNLSNLDCSYWVNKCYEYKKLNPISVNRSNENGYQSQNEIQHLPEFYPLVNLLIKEVSLITPNLNNKITSMWLNISDKGAFNRPHVHGYHKALSGVVYLKTPPNGGNIVFLNPLDINFDKYVFTKEKDIILFNNFIPHYVEPNTSEESRISIAFNYE